MAYVRKQLNALNAVCGPLPLLDGVSGGVTVQYPNGGTGTLVLEAIAHRVDQAVAANWITLTMRNPAGVDVTSLAAVGIGNAEAWAYGAVRVRMSVVGDCTPTLSNAF